MNKEEIEHLERNYYKTTEVGFYIFLRWYEDYIEDLVYERKNKYILSAYNILKKDIAYSFLNEFQEEVFYIDKNYFNIMADFDFNSILPRQTREIITTKKDEKEIKQLKITKYKM